MKYTQGQTFEQIMFDGHDVYVYTEGAANYTLTPNNDPDDAVTGKVSRSDGVTRLGPFRKMTKVTITSTADFQVEMFDFTREYTEFEEAFDYTVDQGVIGVEKAAVYALSRNMNKQEQLTAFGNSITNSAFNFALWFTNASSGEIVYYKNAGVNGDTTQQMIDRIDDIPSDTTLVTVMEGTNDAGNSVSALTHAQNMKLIINTLLEKGFRVLVLTAPPRDSVEQTPVIEEMNAYDYVTARDLGVECYGVWDEFTDASTGQWLSGKSSDGTHPVSSVQQIAGESLLSKYRSKNYYLPLPRNNDFAPSLSTNCCFLDDLDANGSPDGWTSYGGGTRTLTAGAIGNVFKIADTGDATVYIQQTTAGAPVLANKQYLVCFVASASITSGSVTYYLSTPDGERYAIRDASISFSDRVCTFSYTPTTDGSLALGIRITGTGHDASAEISQLGIICIDDYRV